MGYTQDLVSWWDLSDINPADLGFRGLGNDGTGSGLVAATDIVNGIAGGKATEIAVGEYVDFGAPASLKPNLISISLWFKLGRVTISFQHLWGAYFTEGAWLAVDSAEKLAFYTKTGGDASHDAWTGLGPVLTLNQWYHVCAVWDGEQKHVYLDGVLLGSKDVTDGNLNWTGSGNIRIGRSSGASAYTFVGVNDELMIFNSGLTNLQVIDLYNRTRQGRF